MTANLSDATASARKPIIMRNRSAVSSGLTAFDSTTRRGRIVGDLHYDDPYFYYNPVPTWTAAWGATTDGWAQAGRDDIPDCEPKLTAATTPLLKGYAWTPISDSQLGGSGADNTSSVTIVLRLGLTGQRLTAVGCRGNCEFVFTSGDKCVMQFTMTGKLASYNDADDLTLADPVTQALPPTVVGLAAAIQQSTFGTVDAEDLTGAVFNDFSLSLGNDVTLREDMNDSVGYEAAYITGRTGSMTIAPDARPASDTGAYEWWDRLLSGEVTRMRLNLSSDAGLQNANSFTFKMPALQFEQVGDGDRENVMTYEITGAMTGGDNGSSVQEDSLSGDATSSVLNTRLGINNEFALIYG